MFTDHGGAENGQSVQLPGRGQRNAARQHPAHERGACAARSRILPVKRMRDRVLCYMYRPEKLKEDLAGELAQSILAARAYPVGNTERCVAELCRRLQQDAAFPHEVGLFLGYPAGDVDGFIRLGARRAKYVGAWKVYGDVTSAQRRFDLYKKCTRVYREAYKKHNSFDRLIVSCS